MLNYLFSFEGRSGRLSYFFFFIFWAILFVALFVGITFMGFIIPGMAYVAYLGLAIAALLSSFAITVRRLHDMDLTGWVLPFIIIISLASGSYEYWESYLPSETWEDPVSLSCFIGVAFVQIFYWMLLLWPGSESLNRFE